jgi:hypothetical protein
MPLRPGCNLQGNLLPDLNITRHLRWVDPIIGMKGCISISHWFFINARGDVGGFSARERNSPGGRLPVQASKFPGGLP